MKLAATILSILTLAGAVRAGEAEARAEAAYFRAYQLELASRDHEQALKAYEKAFAIAIDAKENALATKALLGRGRCLRALGRVDDAREVFERAITLDPENAEAHVALGELEREKGQDRDDELARQMRELVGKIGQAGSYEAIVAAGRAAVPYLEEGLRSRDVATVQKCARALMTIAPERMPASLLDPDVVFAGAILRSLRPGPGSLELCAAALEHPEREVRRLGADLYTSRTLGDDAVRQDGDFLDRVLASDDGDIASLIRRRPWRGQEERLADVARGWLADPDAAVRLGTLRWLGRFRTLRDELGDAIVALAETDEDPEVVASAIGSAKGIESVRPRLAELLEAALNAPPDSARHRAAVDDLGWIDAEALDTPKVATWIAARGRAEIVTGGSFPILGNVKAAWTRRHPDALESWIGALGESTRPGAARKRLLELVKDWAKRRGLADRRDAYVRALDAASDAELHRAILDECEYFLPLDRLVVEAASEDPKARALVYLALDQFHQASLRELAVLPQLIDDVVTRDRHGYGRSVLRESSNPDYVEPVKKAWARNDSVASTMLDFLARTLPAEDLAKFVERELRRADLGVYALGSLAKLAGRLHLSPCVPRLIELLDHRSGFVQKAAKIAVGSITDHAELLAKLDSSATARRDAAFDRALRLAKSDDPVVRRGAIHAIAALRHPRSIEVLLGLLEDDDASVREAAASALERAGG